MRTFILILALGIGYAWATDLAESCEDAVQSQCDSAFGKPKKPKPPSHPRPITKPK